MQVRKFFAKHPKLRQLVCPHNIRTDIGTLECWNGNEFIIYQCEICGLLFANGKPYRLPGEIKFT